MPSRRSFRLGDVAHIFGGTVGVAKIDKHPPSTPLRREYRVLHPSFLQSPLLDVSQLPLRIDQSRSHSVLRHGDVVGRDFASDRRWTVVPPEYDGVQAGQGLLVVRMNEELMPKEYVAAYLSSSHAEKTIPLTGSVMPRLTRNSLSECIIPICAGDPETIRRASILLTAGPSQVGNITLRLAETQSEIFDTLDPDEIRVKLEQASGLSYLIAQSLRRESEPRRFFQATYPYGIARAMRQLNHSSDLPDQHEAALLCAESAILSLGIFSLAVATERSYRLNEMDTWFRALSQGGASLGHWVGIVRAVGKQARQANN